jgi:hypothetical protein
MATNGQSVVITATTVTDTAANFSAEFDALNADPNLVSIVLTDPGRPALTLTAAQVANDQKALAAISGPYTINVVDTAQDFANYYYYLSSNSQVDWAFGALRPLVNLDADAVRRSALRE